VNILISLFKSAIYPSYFFLSLVKSIKIIYQGNLSEYTGLTPRNSLNQLFYCVQNSNLKKFFRNGISTLVGGGKYSLNNWWHLPSLSLNIFASAPAITVLWCATSIIIWFIYMDITINGILLFSILPLISSLFYINVISNQNYNIIGLMFLSPILYFMLTDNIFYFMAFTVLLSFVSITIYVIFFPLVFFHSYLSTEFNYFLFYIALIPVVFLPLRFCKISEIFDKFSWVFSLMGLATKQHKMRRIKSKSLKMYLRDWHLLISYTFFTFCLFFINAQYFYHIFYFPFMHLINRKLVKFTDDENISASYVITFITFLIFSHKTDFIFFILAYFALFEPIRNPEKISPINISSLLYKLKFFLGNDNKPLLLCFPNPKNNYDDIFNGQRYLVEPISYICNKYDRLVIPDWWAVFNQSNLDNFWIDNKKDLIKAIKIYGINEFIVTSHKYEYFLDKDFIQIGIFDWSKIYKEEFNRILEEDIRCYEKVIWKKFRLNI